MPENICLSGGAEGADQQWGMCAGRAGHAVIHFGFTGHKILVPKEEYVTLTPEQLSEAEPFLARANETLGRKFPTRSDYVNNLLRRNYFQVRDSQSVYAITSFDSDGKVDGGTAWAVQMFIDLNGGQNCPVYVYDQKRSLWFTWRQGWEEISSPPIPSGIWTGVGSRKLLPNGKAEIRALLGYIPPNQEEISG